MAGTNFFHREIVNRLRQSTIQTKKNRGNAKLNGWISSITTDEPKRNVAFSLYSARGVDWSDKSNTFESLTKYWLEFAWQMIFQPKKNLHRADSFIRQFGIKCIVYFGWSITISHFHGRYLAEVASSQRPGTRTHIISHNKCRNYLLTNSSGIKNAKWARAAAAQTSFAHRQMNGNGCVCA